MRVEQKLIRSIVASLIACAVSFANASERKPANMIWQSQSHFKACQKGWELMGERDFQGAMARFEKVERRSNNRYERSQALYGLAQSAMYMGDRAAARESLLEIVDLNQLPNSLHFRSLLFLGQLEYERKDYDDALRWIRQRSELSGIIDEPAHEINASAYLMQGEFERAVLEVEQMIEKADNPERKWYELKLAAYHELEDDEQIRATTEQIERLWPSS